MAGGLVWGGLGVLLFSMSLPASRMAVEAFDPIFVGASRGAVAGLLAAAVLTLERAGWPHRRDWPFLAVVGLGVVLGFPLLTTVAVAQAGAIHGAILTGLLPAGTAVAAVLLARERPSLAFWLAALAGVACILAFAAVQGAGHLSRADGLLLLAVIACSAGYAAGGVLARRMGGLRVIGWALVACLPATLPLTLANWDAHGIATASAPASKTRNPPQPAPPSEPSCPTPKNSSTSAGAAKPAGSPSANTTSASATKTQPASPPPAKSSSTPAASAKPRSSSPTAPAASPARPASSPATTSSPSPTASKTSTPSAA